MASPVGEDSWLAYIEEQAREITDIEQRVNLVEQYKRAVDAEPGSLRLWLGYCDFFWSLWKDSHDDEAAWPEEERLMGQELFALEEALDLWKQGYDALKFRLNDSHLFWDRWISLKIEIMAEAKTAHVIENITQLYRDRLLVPHMTWDQTSQNFSSFLSEHNESQWESSMKDITSRAQNVKRAIDARESNEMKLTQAERNGDVEAQRTALRGYLDWEIGQMVSSKDGTGPHLCQGLFLRALSGLLTTDESTWYDFIVFVSTNGFAEPSGGDLLNWSRRAVQHCPWSGRLWHRYILCAEEADFDFSDVKAIKDAALADNSLLRDGMESMIEMYIAWCAFLKRSSTYINEEGDVAGSEISAAIDNMTKSGKKLYGKEFQGDPKARLERIYIQYLAEKKDDIDGARAQWTKLASVQLHANSHEFWSRYYTWEMQMFVSGKGLSQGSSSASARGVPSSATAVLARALARRTIDWPEKILELYMQHCNEYERPQMVQEVADKVHKIGKAIARRREKEQQQGQAAYAAYYEAQAQQAAQHGAQQDVAETQSPNGIKRKRQEADGAEEDEESDSKRQKGGQSNEATPQPDAGQADGKRDRENATILVTNLPPGVTQTKVRQYFKEYGHINQVTALVQEEDNQSSTALIEFRSAEEARSALLRDGKYFGESQLGVQSGYDLTVYVANYPPEADDAYMRKLFGDCGRILSIRWPSLKVNTHRRFCYISFADRDASAKAVQKEGMVLENKYKLLSKYSNPGHKKSREGALAEGREVYVTNLDRTISEKDVRDVFSKSGVVTRVNVPTTLSGKNRGFAYLDFETKEQAQKAVADLNNVKLKNEIMNVELSKDSKVKLTAKSINTSRDSASPAPRDREGDSAMDDANGTNGKEEKVTAADIKERTITLMGLPDTANDARVRALAEPFGAIRKFVLQPRHGSASIEYVNVAQAGAASLHLDGKEFEGRKLWTGTPDDSRHSRRDGSSSHAPNAEQPFAAKTRGLMAPPAVRRPGGPAGRSGPKRGLGFAPRKAAPEQIAEEKAEGAPTKKSNADFRDMFLKKNEEKEAQG